MDPNSIVVPLLFLAQPPAFSSVFRMQRAGDKPQGCEGGGGDVLPFVAKPLSSCGVAWVPSVTHCLPPTFDEALPPPLSCRQNGGASLPLRPICSWSYFSLSYCEPQVFKMSGIQVNSKIMILVLKTTRFSEELLWTVCHCFLHNWYSFELNHVFSHNCFRKGVFLAENFPNFPGSKTFPSSKFSRNHSTLQA